jgi:hypothetical protein
MPEIAHWTMVPPGPQFHGTDVIAAFQVTRAPESSDATSRALKTGWHH